MALGGMFAVLGSKFIGYPSAGALGCITIAFVAGIGWRRRAAKVLRDARGPGPTSNGTSTSAEYVSSVSLSLGGGGGGGCGPRAMRSHAPEIIFAFFFG